ncbi:transglycosylase SLT domain-containing protein [Roseomonas sp. CCTCC AB2023176]|uniref:transglycosylase SLT domain-containing protein n=1 Tax=Roseomonas sp. CCTCC AB2023176 TaxID=3342640 RepID=UPI0035E282D1
MAAGVARGAGTLSRSVRTFAALSGLALLAACASQEAGPQTPTARHASRPTSYDPPGPPSDPWGPYIREASSRFDVPERWIREVMRQESAGRVSATSRVGAMGLLQLMPGTYAELQRKHALGDDPYHPWDNIMAGTAYIREMYNLYGSPGFLAAYNGGPRRLENYLWGSGSLPAETRNYVARIGPRIEGASPTRRAPAEVYAAAELPLNIPAGPRRMDSGTMLALRDQREQRVAERLAMAQVQPSQPVNVVARMEPIPNPPEAPPARTAVASLGPNVVAMAPIPNPPEPEVTRMDPIPNPPEAPPRGFAEAPRSPFMPPRPQALAAVAPAPSPRGFSFFPQANASPLPPGVRTTAAATPSAGNWAIQVGAFASENLARDAAGTARAGAGNGRAMVTAVSQGRGTLFRARVTGLTRDAAQAACSRVRGQCMVLSPDAQG